MTDEPCEECGAEAGVDCAKDCNAAIAYAEKWELIGTPPREESEIRLMRAVHRLPFNGLVGERGVGAPDRGDYTDGDEWMSALADWMDEYEVVLRIQVEDLEEQSRQRIGMQIERDVLDGVIRRALEGESA